MVDDRAFRTARGRGVVADGRLRVERSGVELLRGAYREQWVRNDPASKLLRLFSFAGTVTLFERALAGIRTLLDGGAVSTVQWIWLGALALGVFAVVRAVARTAEVPLGRIESVTRTDRTVTVEYAADGDAETLEIDARTGADAEQATELLRLKGVPVEDHRGDADGDEDADDDSVTYDLRDALG